MIFDRKQASLLVASAFAAVASAKTHSYNWTASWVDGYNPDGLFERPVIGVNGEWPWPDLKVKKGDRVEILLNNGFETSNTSLHFHGLFQRDNTQMDGPPYVTQCPIAPGESMLYNFTVPDQVGSFWYHSHSESQYGDGMRAAFIIEDTEDYPYDYDEEVILTVAEWYHKDVKTLTKDFMNRYNPTGAEPIPQNLLFNNTRNNSWVVQPDTTYLVHIINVGAFVSQYLYMEDHTFTVVEIDGIYVEKNETEMLYITVAQRYTVLITTKSDTSKNYAFMQKFDDDMLDTIPGDLLLNSTNYIVYNETADLPTEYFVDSIDDFLDDFYLEPLTKEAAYDEPDYQIVIDVAMDNLGDGVNYAFFNNITWIAPKVPTLTTVMSAGEDATNPLVYGNNVNAFVLEKDEVIEIVLNNQDTGKHPFHLHGHVFQVIERAQDYGDEAVPVAYNESAPYDAPEYPMRRDVLYVRPQSYFRIRFKADNPGVWFFHCHIEWHLTQGLAIVLIEDPEGIQANQTLSESWLNACKTNNIPTVGNAAANSQDYLDLSGENKQHKALPAGFTARGIVALVFSCITGVLGCIFIGVYGMADIPDIDQRIAMDLGAEDALLEDDEEEEEESSAPETGASASEGASKTN
ncbi:unnamed protein product [Kuraishia capsulata CBS 1993]|uniref:Iron transport multicopper oxidase FET3 n=1 Tax=Kuraishia capsulata CBS 1993 TaxID=1382522 RepID=W6MU88_9ASCO|nr:uncharacterized protein KUCA_T00004973001 [Kuraishia capsulata CBS 1993]CDK28987.1 unnamed protein product [Kuraishia capsulata CBS 1993]